MDETKSPTVFISYSHGNLEHKNWVLELAKKLNSDGVKVSFDQWDVRIGADLRFFMEKGILNSNLVLCICSEEYVKKVNSGIGGAGYEGMILSQPLLSNVNLDFIIPIIRNNTSKEKLPKFFGNKLYLDFSNDNVFDLKYNELIERIYDEDLKKRPPLGKKPFSTKLNEKNEVKIKIKSDQYYSQEINDIVNFRYDNNNGKYTIGNGDYKFETKWSRSDNNSIYAYGQIGYIHGEKEIPDPEHLNDFDYSSNVRNIKTGEIIIYKNANHHFAAVKLIQVKSSNHGNPYDEMTFEYHIYYPG